MKQMIVAKNFVLTPAISNYIDEKFQRLESKVNTHLSTRFNLSVDKNGQKIEAMVYIGKTLIKAEATHENLYTAIDKLMNKLDYQIHKYLRKKHKKQHQSIRWMEEMKEKEGQEMTPKPIVKRKRFDMKPMMEDEAILQMEMLGHSFFFFLNGETDTMCLLYKRKDGNYGLIEGIR